MCTVHYYPVTVRSSVGALLCGFVVTTPKHNCNMITSTCSQQQPAFLKDDLEKSREKEKGKKREYMNHSSSRQKHTHSSSQLLLDEQKKEDIFERGEFDFDGPFSKYSHAVPCCQKQEDIC